MKNIIIGAFVTILFFNQADAQTKNTKTNYDIIFGKYNGFQESYSTGKINGNDIIIPKVEHDFCLFEDYEVVMTLTAYGNYYYYTGKYKITKLANGEYTVLCNLTDFQNSSKPKYKLTFKSDGQVICNQLEIKNPPPPFNLKKIKNKCD
jgi:hypothetical protein